MDLGHWAKAGRALARHARSRSFIRELGSAGLRADQEVSLPSHFLFDRYPELADAAVDLGIVAFSLSNMDPYEQYVVGALVQHRRPGRIFEIGTYDGATTLLLARNAPDAEVFTIDLPPAQATSATVMGEIANVERGVGSRFHRQPEAERITQLLGDTRKVNFTPWYGSIDFVLVDAGHEFENARADTETALALLAPRGMIIWDDCTPGWPGVVDAVSNAAVPVFSLEGTDLALHDARSP